MEKTAPVEANNSVEDSFNPNTLYADFVETVITTRRQIDETDDNMSNLNCQVASTLFAAATIFNPDILHSLYAIEEEGRRIDQSIATAEAVQAEIVAIANSTGTNPAEHFQALLSQLGLKE